MDEMKTLVFGEGLMRIALNGSKNFTVRKYREGAHDFVKGEVIKGEFKDGLTILLRITRDTVKGRFREIAKLKKNLKKNGYYFDVGYFNDLAFYYKNLSWDDMGAIVCFEILKVEGVPIASFNGHIQWSAWKGVFYRRN